MGDKIRWSDTTVVGLVVSYVAGSIRNKMVTRHATDVSLSTVRADPKLQGVGSWAQQAARRAPCGHPQLGVQPHRPLDGTDGEAHAAASTRHPNQI